ncbi:MAG TPA: ferritin family protein [Negativicutes bacterium]|nr:ferritin family protein [Negativicutes bacterium]
MSSFGSPNSGLANQNKLSNDELIRAIRFLVASEYEAVRMYTQLADSIDNKIARAMLKEIADQEVIHAGEFLKLLCRLAPDKEHLCKRVENKAGKIMKETPA